MTPTIFRGCSHGPGYLLQASSWKLEEVAIATIRMEGGTA